MERFFLNKASGEIKISCNNDWDAVVIGCGFAGAVVARELAERANKRVLVLEQRPHVGGNGYDCNNADGILVHQYGPHIFHTNEQRVFDYLSRFTAWREYDHQVVADLEGILLPVPFNLNSLQIAFEKNKAERLTSKLISTYGLNSRVTLNELRSENDTELSELAAFVYQNVFSIYTQKQWGLSPEELDPAVIARVPIIISHDNRYFQDKHQGIPANGYTSLFEQMLDHPLITVKLGVPANTRIAISAEGIILDGEPFGGEVIYTGAPDELFDCRFGRLPYRTLDFAFETHPIQWFQSKGTVNYTVSREYTRITEFKHLTGQVLANKTTIVKEFSRPYTGNDGEIPYYAISSPQNNSLYNQYCDLAQSIPRFTLLGRLAQYKYYNMDTITLKALQLADKLVLQYHEG